MRFFDLKNTPVLAVLSQNVAVVDVHYVPLYRKYFACLGQNCPICMYGGEKVKKKTRAGFFGWDYYDPKDPVKVFATLSRDLTNALYQHQMSPEGLCRDYDVVVSDRSVSLIPRAGAPYWTTSCPDAVRAAWERPSRWSVAKSLARLVSFQEMNDILAGRYSDGRSSAPAGNGGGVPGGYPASSAGQGGYPSSSGQGGYGAPSGGGRGGYPLPANPGGYQNPAGQGGSGYPAPAGNGNAPGGYPPPANPVGYSTPAQPQTYMPPAGQGGYPPPANPGGYQNPAGQGGSGYPAPAGNGNVPGGYPPPPANPGGYQNPAGHGGSGYPPPAGNGGVPGGSPAPAGNGNAPGGYPPPQNPSQNNAASAGGQGINRTVNPINIANPDETLR